MRNPFALSLEHEQSTPFKTGQQDTQEKNSKALVAKRQLAETGTGGTTVRG